MLLLFIIRILISFFCFLLYFIFLIPFFSCLDISVVCIKILYTFVLHRNAIIFWVIIIALTRHQSWLAYSKYVWKKVQTKHNFHVSKTKLLFNENTNLSSFFPTSIQCLNNLKWLVITTFMFSSGAMTLWVLLCRKLSLRELR